MQSFDVKEMSCDHCAAAIKAAIEEVDPEAKVDVDLGAAKVVVRDETAPADVLIQAMATEGYEAVPTGD